MPVTGTVAVAIGGEIHRMMRATERALVTTPENPAERSKAIVIAAAGALSVATVQPRRRRSTAGGTGPAGRRGSAGPAGSRGRKPAGQRRPGAPCVPAPPDPDPRCHRAAAGGQETGRRTGHQPGRSRRVRLPAADRAGDAELVRLVVQPVLLPGPAVGAREPVERDRRQPGVGRLRHRAGAARLPDGQRRTDWQTSAATQITWGLRYIRDTYGSPCAAWCTSRPPAGTDDGR